MLMYAALQLRVPAMLQKERCALFYLQHNLAILFLLTFPANPSTTESVDSSLWIDTAWIAATHKIKIAA